MVVDILMQMKMMMKLHVGKLDWVVESKVHLKDWRMPCSNLYYLVLKDAHSSLKSQHLKVNISWAQG